jgi:hypothetical protein
MVPVKLLTFQNNKIETPDFSCAPLNIKMITIVLSMMVYGFTQNTF